MASTAPWLQTVYTLQNIVMDIKLLSSHSYPMRRVQLLSLFSKEKTEGVRTVVRDSSGRMQQEQDVSFGKFAYFFSLIPYFFSF